MVSCAVMQLFRVKALNRCRVRQTVGGRGSKILQTSSPKLSKPTWGHLHHPGYVRHSVSLQHRLARWNLLSLRWWFDQGTYADGVRLERVTHSETSNPDAIIAFDRGYKNPSRNNNPGRRGFYLRTHDSTFRGPSRGASMSKFPIRASGAASSTP